MKKLTLLYIALVVCGTAYAQDPVMIQGFYWNVRPGGV